MTGPSGGDAERGLQRLSVLGAFMAGFGGLLGMLGLLLICSSPVMILEGEEPGAIVLGVVWGGMLAGVGVGLGVAGIRLRSGRGRAMALAMAVVQAPLAFCFCTLPSVGLLLATLILLLVDADVAEALREA